MESSSFSSFSSFSSSLTSSSSDLEAGCAPAGGSARAGAPVRSRSLKSMFFCDGLGDAGPRHFLDACFLCRRALGGNRDIFMYRGNMPFCSEECRQEQIEIDEGKEPNWKLSLTSTSRKDSAPAVVAGGGSPPKSHKVHVRTGAAVVAG